MPDVKCAELGIFSLPKLRREEEDAEADKIEKIVTDRLCAVQEQ